MQRHYRSILVNIPVHQQRDECLAVSDESMAAALTCNLRHRQNGMVLFAESHADFRVRPEPEDVLSVL